MTFLWMTFHGSHGNITECDPADSVWKHTNNNQLEDFETIEICLSYQISTVGWNIVKGL